MALELEIFRTYDIRGIVDKTLTDSVAFSLGQALGTKVQRLGEQALLVGRDARLSSETLKDAFAKGVTSAGCNVIDIGLVPTPVLYFANYAMDIPSGVMITGSHNPKDYNGFKMVIGGKTIYGEEILGLYHQIQQKDFLTGSGVYECKDLLANYVDAVCQDIQIPPENSVTVVVDCGNGIAGKLAPALFERLGCKVIPLYCEVDGNFPNHHPDPGQPENLENLIDLVKKHQADIGFGFDGDGDRIGVVDNLGKIIWPDRVLAVFAKAVLKKHPHTPVIFDIKCTNHLFECIESYGGTPVISPTGHSLIKASMQANQALLAGELSGHLFIKDRWYGFDDALYAGARLLEILFAQEKNPRTSSEQFAEIPENFSTPEIRLAVLESEKFQFIEKLKENNPFEQEKITTIDGIRVDFEDGWGLVRASNTSAFLILRFEANTQTRLLAIQQAFQDWFTRFDPKLVFLS